MLMLTRKASNTDEGKHNQCAYWACQLYAETEVSSALEQIDV